MRFSTTAATLILAVIAAAALVPASAMAQGQLQLLPLKPPPPPPIKPYTPVAAAPPQPYGDPGFQALRKQIADAVAHKDRAALAKLTATQGFFWIQDKDRADPQKPGIDNLAKALNLDTADGSGWDVLGGYANEPTAADLPDQKGVICAPADPAIEAKAFQALVEATQTDPTEWGYPLKDGVEVHAAPQPSAPVIETLGPNLVHVLPEAPQAVDGNGPPFLHVATPSGKTGFVALDAISPLGGDQMCYAKDASGWKVAGYFGGAAQ
jgi:hypothetical protein